ncbi:protein neprosin-like isoform X1 [Lycium barbarum]|uniref:protein neprosin-like isoform X1 n=1 Tax=Lycium barbarum TaxID=112863 RepID=UPI00293E0999|nr:protein neprosin-like isoform X1 [Lycium barbarum]
MLMHQKIIRQSLLVLYLLISYDGVQGKTMLSKLEDLELEEQLKLLNKPSIKTIKSKYGDIYNCVDFYKQPTFDHPLLKNHNFHPQMKPTLARPKQNSSTSETSWSSRIWSKDGDCPFGTVPIKIITKEDLVRQRNMPPPEDVIIDTELTNTINNTSDSKGRYISSQAYKLAIVRTLKNQNNKFGGAGMATSLYNPHVEGQQHSACRLKIQKGSDILQVGWRVDPTLYRDSKTRLFIHFQAGNKHCFNVLCPGFVLVNNEIPIDMAFDKISRRGERRTWEFRMFIDRDLVNGNWWPLLAKTYVKIGFWPQKIFTSLASFANNIEWGGVAYSPPGVPKPPMGSSFFPIAQSNYDAYCRGLSVLNDKGATIDVDETTIYVDDPKLYQVLDYPHAAPGKFQHWVFYGGPGESHQL